MSILLGYKSALDYWRSCATTTDPLLHKALLGSSVARSNATSSAALGFNRQPCWNHTLQFIACHPDAHVVVLNNEVRRAPDKAVVHLIKNLPKGSCIAANSHFHGNKMFVSTPEYCFLQMAELLTLEELIQLGYEMCGTYSLCPDGTVFNTFPLTTEAKIASFLEKANGIRGVQQARRAIQYVIDSSASPMETALAMMLTLPYSLGGFGIKAPQLNSRVDLPASIKRISPSSYYVCDLHWPEANLAIEYDSDLAHSGINKTIKDAMRRSVLTTLGLYVLSVTKPQVKDTEAFYQLAHLVAKKSGKRLQYKNPGFSIRHRRLRSIVLSSTHQ